jgi:hypothetical protein
MKRKVFNTVFIRKISITLLILLFSAAYGYSAQISFMAGDVKVFRSGKQEKAALQMKLASGDVLRTGKLSFADVSYDDGTVIKVSENSSVIIGNKNVQASDSLSVTSGMISAKFAKLQKDSTRKVYTPTTVCAVRGTEFKVAVSDSADSKVQLTEGSIDVSNSYGKTVLGENQSAEIEVAKAPAEADDGNLDTWKNDNESKLVNNPEEQADDFSQYVKDFQKRSENASRNIGNIEKNKSTALKGGKESLDDAVKDLNSLAGEVEDDMYLSSAANNSIDGILSRFQKDKKDIYHNFLKVKKESNKVLDQQQKNYQAITAVKEAYKKAFDSIMNKHKGEVDKIKGSYDKEGVKPKK